MVDERLSWGENRVRQPESWVGPYNAVRVRVEELTGVGTNIDRMDVSFKGIAQ